MKTEETINKEGFSLIPEGRAVDFLELIAQELRDIKLILLKEDK